MALKPALTFCSWRRKSATVASRRNERSTPYKFRDRIPEKASAVSRSVLLGNVPELMPGPPSSFWEFTSAAFLLHAAAVGAPMKPAGSPPITTKSYDFEESVIALFPPQVCRH